MIHHLFTESEQLKGVICKAISRHFFDGAIFLEKNKYDEDVWREHFECQFCLTKRTSNLEPETCIVEYRHYEYQPEFKTGPERAECVRIFTKRILSASNSI